MVVSSDPLRTTECSGTFVEHRLRHMTRARTGDVLPFDTNGSGLAVGDLDGDGLPEIVIGDLRRSASVLWNHGRFTFERTALTDSAGGLDETNTRSVVIVDVDADGRNDIVTTHTGGGVSVWTNTGDRTFRSSSFDAVSTPAYSMLWDDFDGDGDLEFATGSYDALLEREQGNSFLLGSGAGVVVYEKVAGLYQPNRLIRAAQSLALVMFDTNGDGRRELVVGNDFGVPDAVYSRSQGGSWSAVEPFTRISRNTMAFAVGDVGNDGLLDLFATDMKPSSRDPETVAAWMPLLSTRFDRVLPGDSQQPENVFQRQTRPGQFSERAYATGIDATGWSWSAQFGDLDLDGHEDLYVVNGMIDHELLGHLRNDELAEPNVVFAAGRAGRFRRKPEWGLGSRASGRAMAMVDLDLDGRLDIVVNNLESPAVVFANKLCSPGAALEVDLRWPGRGNKQALGAVVVAKLDTGMLQRTVTATGGYLTGLDARVHFGIPAGRTVQELLVVWPDGHTSAVDSRGTGHLVTITRTAAP